MFIRFDMIHERDGHTDRQTDGHTPHNGIGRAYALHRAETNVGNAITRLPIERLARNLAGRIQPMPLP